MICVCMHVSMVNVLFLPCQSLVLLTSKEVLVDPWAKDSAVI